MRKIFLYCMGLLMSLTISNAQDAWWPLNTNADDSVGTQDGVTNAGVSFVTDKIRGQVMKLDGATGFVQLPSRLMDGIHDITITCYFNFAGGANWQRVYSFGNALPAVRTLYLCPKDGWAGNKLHLTLGGPNGLWRDYTPQTIETNRWYFAAFVKKGDSLLLYLDNKVIAADTFVTDPADLSPDSANYLGKSHWADPTFNGLIDDVKLYKSALTKEEVMALYTPLGEDAYWPLNANANDTLGTQHGVTNAGVSFVTDKIRGQVMKLDGATGFVQLPVGLLENVRDVTITGYFNFAGGANWQRVYSFGNALPAVRTLYLCPKDGWAGNKLHLTLGGANGLWRDYTPTTIETDRWYFTAFVKKGDSLLLYLNDEVVAADTFVTDPADLFPDSANYLGKSHWADPTFNGMIDDMRFFASALTREEIMALYTPLCENAYWPLNVNADDTLGTQDGVANAGVSFVTDKIRGQVMKLDGATGFVKLPLGLLENVRDVTITGYFNFAGGADWQRVYSFGNALPNVRTLYLCPKDGWAGNKLHLTLGGAFGLWRDYTPVAVETDRWYFTAFVKKGDSLLFYLDDEVVAADTFITDPEDLFPDSANYLGKSHWADATFNGMIDDVRFITKALTKEEIMTFYTPLYEDAWWPLNANADDTLGTQDGVVNAGVSFVTDPDRGQVMKLDGETGFVHIPVGLLENVRDATITCYFNFAGGANWQRVYSFGNALPNVRTLYLSPKDGWAGNNLHLTLGGAFGLWRDYTPVAIDTNRWYFSAFVKKGDSLLLYLDDQVVAADTFITDPGDLFPDSANYLGKSHWADPTFNGLIDDVRFYTKALTQEEVLALFTRIYPGINPISINEPLIYARKNQIVVKLNDEGSAVTSLSVYDLLGKKIFHTQNLSDLSNVSFRNGIYLVSIISKGQVYTSKVIVN